MNCVFFSDLKPILIKFGDLKNKKNGEIVLSTDIEADDDFPTNNELIVNNCV